MKQIASNYSYSPTANVVTLTGVNIDQDQLLLVVAPQVGRTMYNFASGVTGVVSAGADTRVTLNASTAGLTTTSPLVIFYDDHAATQPIAGTVTANVPNLVFESNSPGFYGVPAMGLDNSDTYKTIGLDENGKVFVNVSGTVTANGGNFLNADNALLTKDSASNIVLVGGLNYSATPTQSAIDAIRTDGSGAVVVYSGQTNWTDTNAGNQPRSASQQTPFPVQVLGGSVTIGSFPVQLSTTTIGGTARLNVTLSSATTVGGTAPTFANLYGGTDGTNLRAISVDTSGRTVVTVANTVPISGTVTANAFGYDPYNATYPQLSIGKASDGFVANDDVVKAIIGNEGGVINTSNPLHISGAVTVGAMPNGSLTTRFGTPTTANTAFATSAVTNTSRKYLLIQNVTTGSNVITVGIGFTPTTTQGIQLTAGAGITFESSYIPTGAVQILSSVTASNFTILEA